jgi:quercetin dioxygenase-like cupin family protein
MALRAGHLVTCRKEGIARRFHPIAPPANMSVVGIASVGEPALLQTQNMPISVDEATLPDQRWEDPTRGTIRFRTLISAPDTQTHSLVCGVAMLATGETFVLHSHAHPEVYFGLEGEGEVIIDGRHHRLAPGIAIFIPGGAVHGIPVATSPLKWFYTFAADSFAEIVYRFPHEEATS